jgi:RNA polymerase sigma-70 factor, ECF subfamily
MKEPLDQGSFNRLFQEEFEGLVLFAIRYVKDCDAARDIVQEVFVNLWNKRAEIDRSRPYKTYLTTSVKNRSLNHLRDHKKFDTHLLIQENLYPTPTTVQQHQIDIAQLQQQIDDAIAALPEKCREIFLLNRNEHLKYQEIADQLDISVKTVETQMSKALKHLRHHLKDYLTILLFLTLPTQQFLPGDSSANSVSSEISYSTLICPHNDALILNQGLSPFMCIITG